MILKIIDATITQMVYLVGPIIALGYLLGVLEHHSNTYFYKVLLSLLFQFRTLSILRHIKDLDVHRL